MSDPTTPPCLEQNAAGVITAWTSQAEQLFGWTAAEMIGRPSHALVPARNQDRNDRSVRELFAGADGRVYTREVTGLHRDGGEFSMRVVTARRGGADGRLVAWIERVEPQSRAADAFLDVDRYRAILDQIEDGCCVTDLKGRYLFVNDAYCRMFNYERSELVGASFRQTTGAERVTKIAAEFSEVYRTGRPVRSFEYEVFPKNRPPMFIEQSISLERNAAGMPIGFLSITRDCTARRKAAQALEQARAAAEAANRAKSDFLANMSHEIRTPMNGIIGMTALALATDLTPEQRDCIATVQTSAQSLLTVVNDILDFAKIESRRLELESVPFALVEVLGDALKPLAVRADQKGLELLVDISPAVPEAIVGDPVRLRQILTNLVGNAIKFTERGHVIVSIGVDARRSDAATLHFQIADTGIGIPADRTAAIFDPFTQADGSTTRRFGGTGLGLAISSTLVDMMGGRIWVDSRPGAGSVFHFTASFDVADRHPRARPLAAVAAVRALVVDDNEVNRRILIAQLVDWGMRPLAVAGGAAAIDAMAAATAEGDPFRLVLLDAQMPVMDGFALAASLKARPNHATATIMMLSSSGLDSDVRRCREIGISAYLTKPIQGPALLDAIRRTMAQHPAAEGAPETDSRATTAAARPARPVAVPRVQTPLRVLVAEDNVVNQRVVVGLLSKRGHEATVVGDGREAIDMLERELFDVVLMDVQMPVLSGFEATAAIRERERGTDVHQRVIAMTAHAMTGDRERCLAAGMDGYVSKPIEPAALFAAVESEQTEAPSAVAFDRAGLLARLDGDEALAADVIQLFLDDCPIRVSAIKAAVDARDAEQIRSAAHALKGAAGSIAATGLFQAAQALERIGAEGRLAAASAAWKQLAGAATLALDALRDCSAASPERHVQ